MVGACNSSIILPNNPFYQSYNLTLAKRSAFARFKYSRPLIALSLVLLCAVFV